MLKVGFQIDKLHKLNFKSDSTFVIMEEAFKRGFEIYFYYPSTLSSIGMKVFSQVYKVKNIDNTKEIPILYEESMSFDLSNLDIILLRQDPPFDMAYITSTFLLEKIMNKVKIVNNPVSVRNSPEKMMATEFFKMMPETIITRNVKDIKNFMDIHGTSVIKPLYGHGGEDVFLLEEGNFNTNSIISYFLSKYKEQVMIQKFLPNIKQGDKRIIMINGKALGAFSRVPSEKEIKSNLVAGGQAIASKLTEKEQEICKVLAPKLVQMGLDIVGLDIIDNYLTEINVTSPTGFRTLINLENNNLAVPLWDYLVENFN